MKQNSCKEKASLYVFILYVTINKIILYATKGSI